MARFDVYALNEKQKQEMMDQFFEAMASARNKKEMGEVCRDIFSDSEISMFVRRVQAAILLNKGWTVEKISKKLKASPNQIQDVKASMTMGGKGYSLIIKRLKAKFITPQKKKKSHKDSRPPYWTMAYWLYLGR